MAESMKKLWSVEKQTFKLSFAGCP